jgi:hypothetical protein
MVTPAAGDNLYGLAADLILLTHALFVAFVICGFLLIWIGWMNGWIWVRNWWFRVLHIGAIGVVVLQAWAGRLCPLTVWENRLRAMAGQPAYEESFTRYWVHELLFYDAAAWVFTLLYSIFGLFVVLTWLVVTPVRPGRGTRSA